MICTCHLTPRTDDLSGATSGIISIKAGETSGTFTIDTVDNEIVEGSKDFSSLGMHIATQTDVRIPKLELGNEKKERRCK